MKTFEKNETTQQDGKQKDGKNNPKKTPANKKTAASPKKNDLIFLIKASVYSL